MFFLQVASSINIALMRPPAAWIFQCGFMFRLHSCVQNTSPLQLEGGTLLAAGLCPVEERMYEFVLLGSKCPKKNRGSQLPLIPGTISLLLVELEPLVTSDIVVTCGNWIP